VVPVPDGDDNLSYETKVTIIIVCCVLITTMALFSPFSAWSRRKNDPPAAEAGFMNAPRPKRKDSFT
jgi:hypothetical protein